jgi:hypothetical protein
MRTWKGRDVEVYLHVSASRQRFMLRLFCPAGKCLTVAFANTITSQLPNSQARLQIQGSDLLRHHASVCATWAN